MNEENQYSMLRYDTENNEKLQVITILRTKDYKEWQVSSPDYLCIYHSSGCGYKGNTPQQNIKCLVEEITDDFNNKGYFNIEVKEKVVVPCEHGVGCQRCT